MHKLPALGFLVADGSRARLLLRHGDGRYSQIATFARDPAFRPRRDTRTRVFASGGAARSAVGEAKPLQEDAFAQTLSEAVERSLDAGAVERLAIVAPPRMLAALRRTLSARALAHVAAETPKDVTKLPEAELRPRLDALAARAAVSGVA